MAFPSDRSSIPLLPKSIVDLVWGLSLFFSYDEQEQKYGEGLKKDWDALKEKYMDNQTALYYLDNVNAVLSGTVYHLAQLRQEVTNEFKYLNSLQERRIGDLDDLANLSKDAESIATRIIGARAKISEISDNLYGSGYKLDKEIITNLSSGSAMLQSGSFFTGSNFNKSFFK